MEIINKIVSYLTPILFPLSWFTGLYIAFKILSPKKGANKK